MIVKHLDQILGTEADVDTTGWTSRRLILKDAGMGYSVHDTVIKAGAELDMHYKNHLETVYLTEGAGELVDLATGVTHQLRVGSIYALNQHDHHLLKANQGSHMRMVCVFNPPITGNEVHDESGAYALSD